MPNTPDPPERRLKGWRYKGKDSAPLGLPRRDIPLHEAQARPDWLEILEKPSTRKYFQPEYTRQDRGEH